MAKHRKRRKTRARRTGARRTGARRTGARRTKYAVKRGGAVFSRHRKMTAARKALIRCAKHSRKTCSLVSTATGRKIAC